MYYAKDTLVLSRAFQLPFTFLSTLVVNIPEANNDTNNKYFLEEGLDEVWFFGKIFKEGDTAVADIKKNSISYDGPDKCSDDKESKRNL